MKAIKIVTISLLINFLLQIITFADYGIYYGTNKNYAQKTFSKFDMMIIQPYNFDLYKNYTGKKICYLTVWEFDWTQTEFDNLGLSESKIWVNNEWNSIIIDMSNKKWQEYVLQKSNDLKKMWCDGMFLDTIWNDWQEKGAIEIVKKLRKNWQKSIIIPNNPHNIKKDIVDYVDGAMFENFWDYGTNEKSSEWIWYKNVSEEYNKLYISKWKPIYVLSYWNPYKNAKMKIWWEKVLTLAKNYEFQVIFTDYDLTKIFAHKKNNSLNQFK